MTVRENIDLGCYSERARREKRHTLERVLALFPGLKDRLQQLAGTLSGGEQQMLAIARGLMALPRLLVLLFRRGGLILAVLGAALLVWIIDRRRSRV